MVNLEGYIHNVATRLTRLIPMLGYYEARDLVRNYIDSVGGWNPIVVGEPTGNGEPDNGADEDQATEEISTAYYEKVSSFTLDLTVNLRVNMMYPIDADLTDEDSIGVVLEPLEDMLRNAITQTRFDIVGAPVITSAAIVRGGYVTAAQRVAAYQDSITTDPDNPLALAVLHANRMDRTLDQNWGAVRIAVNPTGPIGVILRRYTSTTFVTEDLDELTEFVITMDRETYALQSGVRIPR